MDSSSSAYCGRPKKSYPRTTFSFEPIPMQTERSRSTRTGSYFRTSLTTLPIPVQPCLQSGSHLLQPQEIPLKIQPLQGHQRHQDSKLCYLWPDYFYAVFWAGSIINDRNYKTSTGCLESIQDRRSEQLMAKTSNDVIEVITTRRCVRKYLGKEISILILNFSSIARGMRPLA